MKRIILIVLLIISAIAVFAQEDDISVRNMKLSNIIYNTASGAIDTVIVNNTDSVGQFKYKNMSNPATDLDGVNLRTLADSIDALGNEFLKNPVDSVVFKPNSADTRTEWKLWANKQLKTLSYWRPTGDFFSNITEELITPVKNNTSDTLFKTMPLSVDTVDLELSVITAIPTDATDLSSSEFFIGLAEDDIPPDSTGIAIRFGAIGGVNTSNWERKDRLYVRPDTCCIDTAQAVAPFYSLFTGTVLVKDAVNGVIGVNVESFTGNDTQVNWQGALNGMVTHTPSIRDTIIAGVPYADISNEDYPEIDLPFLIKNKRYLLNTLTNTGKDGAARVQLSYGTDSIPVTNYVYIDNWETTPILAVSTTGYPSGKPRLVALGLYSQTKHATDGFAYVRRVNNGVDGSDASGLILDMTSRIRRIGSGIDRETPPVPTVSIVTSAGIDTLKVETTAGLGYQFREQTIEALSTPVTWWYSPNGGDSTITNLSDINQLPDGTSLRTNNSRYRLDFFIAINSSTYESRLCVTVSSDTYASDQNCYDDFGSKSITTPPSYMYDIVVRFIALPLRYTTGGGGTLTNLVDLLDGTTGGYQSTLNYPFGQGGAGASTGGGVSYPLSDAVWSLFNNADPTATAAISVSNVPTGTQSLQVFPSTSDTLATRSDFPAYVPANETDPIFVAERNALTNNYLPKRGSTTLENSSISDDGIKVNVAADLNVDVAIDENLVVESGSGAVKLRAETDLGAEQDLNIESNTTKIINDGLTTMEAKNDNVVSIPNGELQVDGTGDSYFVGNVGIGTTSPSSKLDVTGDASFQAGGDSSTPVVNFNVTGTTAFSFATSALMPNMSGGDDVAHFIGKEKSSRGMASFGYGYAGSGSTNNYATIGLFGVDNIANFYADRRSEFTGNVGIGTSTTSDRLTVVSGGGNLASFFSTNPTTNEIFLGGSKTSNDCLVFGFDQTNDFGYIQMYGDIKGDALIIGDGGNIGIGTTSPTEKLDVVGNIKASSEISAATGKFITGAAVGYHALSNADGTLTWTDPAAINISDFTNNAGYASQLSELSDVNTSTPTNRNFLIADGIDWESRAIEALDLPDLSSIYQPLATSLTSITGLTTAADKMIYTTASDVYATTDLTAFARSILDDADAATVRATIGAGTGEGDALTTNPLSQFAATTSTELAGVVSDETGTGFLVFNNSPTLTTPNISDFTNATHDHSNAANGGQFSLANLTGQIDYNTNIANLPDLGDYVTSSLVFGTDNKILTSDGTGRGSQASGVTISGSNISSVDAITAGANISTSGGTISAGVGFNTTSGDYRINNSPVINSSSQWVGSVISNAYIANDITLDNITQINTRPITSLTANNWKVWYSNGSGVPTELTLGAANTVLTSNGASSAPTWETPSAGFSDPMTTRGDIIYRNASNVTDRLGVGSNNQILTNDGTDISWGDRLWTGDANGLALTTTGDNIGVGAASLATSKGYFYTTTAAEALRAVNNSATGYGMVIQAGDTDSYNSLTLSDYLGSTKHFFTSDGAFGMIERTAPTEVSGYGLIYAKTDGKLYYKNDGGSEFDLTVGGGSGVTSVSSTTTNQLTVANSTTTPALTIVTTSVGSGQTGLVTSGDIYTFINSNYAPLSSPSFAGTITSDTPSTSYAPLNIPHGNAPSSPTNGDIWTTTSGMFARINGVTKDLTVSGGSGTVTSVSQGNGMNFTTITATGTIDLATPLTLTESTTNSAGGAGSGHSHSITGFVEDGGDTMTGQLTMSGTNARINTQNVTRDIVMLSGSPAVQGKYWAIENDENRHLIFQSSSDNSTYNTKFKIDAINGTTTLYEKIIANDYGSGSYTGTAAYNIEVTAGGSFIETTAGSDYRKKKDFRKIIDPIKKLKEVNTYSFNWREDYPKKAIDEDINIELMVDTADRESSGVIAQELKDIIPEAVKQYNNGYYMVDYDALVPYLIEAVKQQQQEIDQLKKGDSNIYKLILIALGIFVFLYLICFFIRTHLEIRNRQSRKKVVILI